MQWIDHMLYLCKKKKHFPSWSFGYKGKLQLLNKDHTTTNHERQIVEIHQCFITIHCIVPKSLLLSIILCINQVSRVQHLYLLLFSSKQSDWSKSRKCIKMKFRIRCRIQWTAYLVLTQGRRKVAKSEGAKQKCKAILRIRFCFNPGLRP